MQDAGDLRVTGVVVRDIFFRDVADEPGAASIWQCVQVLLSQQAAVGHI